MGHGKSMIIYTHHFGYVGFIYQDEEGNSLYTVDDGLPPGIQGVL